jgi:hypothetical protein
MGTGAALSRQRRSSSTDRERAARRLREACVDERISQDTFTRRLDLVYAARTQDELDWIVADIPQPTWATRAVVAGIEAVSRWTLQFAAAWREPRALRLTLPSSAAQLTLGRSRRCNCVVSDLTVSRLHATIERTEGGWWLRDAGSSNGTWVNGCRVTDPVEVHPGDQVALGRCRFVLVRPPA